MNTSSEFFYIHISILLLLSKKVNAVALSEYKPCLEICVKMCYTVGEVAHFKTNFIDLKKHIYIGELIP